MENMSTMLGRELIGLNNLVEEQQYYIYELQLKAALYKAYFFHKHSLTEKIENQLHDNIASSILSGKTYRTLEDMYMQDLITESEYKFCRV